MTKKIVSLLALCACTPSGTGVGDMSRANSLADTVSFAWSAESSQTGHISAKLPAGETFAGTYIQVTKDLTYSSLKPMWVDWDEGWSSWPELDANGNTEFLKHYTRRVVATLRSSEGRRMRCRFRLNSIFEGMSGGGYGECEISTGRHIDAEFPPT